MVVSWDKFYSLPQTIENCSTILIYIESNRLIAHLFVSLPISTVTLIVVSLVSPISPFLVVSISIFVVEERRK